MKQVVVFALVFLSSCITFRPTHMITGAVGRQCRLPRPVQCDVGNTDCEHVEGAIHLINFQAGQELLSFHGYTSCYTVRGPAHTFCLADEAARGTLVVTLNPKPRPVDPFEKVQPAGATMLEIDQRSGCIRQEVILLEHDGKSMSYGFRRRVILHELLHALGLPHTNLTKSDTLMRPADPDDNEIPTYIPEADLALLHALYGRF